MWAGLELADHVLRKLAHVAEYAMFALLFYGPREGTEPAAARRMPAAFVYVLIDDYHQIWVLGRHTSWVDCGFDQISLERRAKAFAGNDGGWSHQMTWILKCLANASLAQ